MTDFVRPDWTLFRSLNTLSQKAGVSVASMPKLVIKELMDNALDAGESVTARISGNGFHISDDGGGLPGNDDEIADLFSIGRPLRSTKLLRLPTRGALGNGLRVVAGAVTATGGDLTVCTHGRRLRLVPNDDGTTTPINLGGWDGTGTHIDIELGQALRVNDGDSLEWAREAILLAWAGKPYKGKSSPHWYDADSFFELLMASGDRPVRDLIANLDGCTGGKAGKIAEPFLGRDCQSLSRDEAETLLISARSSAGPVNAKRLGCIGQVDGLPASYATTTGSFTAKAARGTIGATIPFVVEAWVDVATDKAETIAVHISVNRTPITADVDCQLDDKKSVALFGAGLSHIVAKAGRLPPCAIWISIITPYMPITSDGKEPDLKPMLREIVDVVERATNSAKRTRNKSKQGDTVPTQKAVVYANVERARDWLSEGGRLRFDQRNFFYEIRPNLMNEAKVDRPLYNTFNRILTEYENEMGDIAGLTRDNRGILYTPHSGAIVMLGTRNVETYKRPAWQFNKILYIEKEGFFSTLIDEKWPEKHDCALLTAKGQATRAAKDLLDFLGKTGEDLLFFCLHDADAYGTTIYHSLQNASPSRPGRKVKVINLGLEPWEAVAMGLQIEDLPKEDAKKPVADYVRDEWAAWLQEHRCELNVLGPAAFLRWLDQKMDEHGAGKLLPTTDIVTEEYGRVLEETVRQSIAERILREAGLDALVASHLATLPPAPVNLMESIQVHLAEVPTQSWREPVSAIARAGVGVVVA